MATSNVRASVMAALPNMVKQTTIKKTIDELTRLKATKMCQLVGGPLQSEVNSVIGFIRALDTSEGISKEKYNHVSDQMKTMLLKMVNYFSVVNPKQRKLQADGKPARIFGAKAIETYYSQCEAIVKKKGLLGDWHVSPFRI